LLWWLLGIPFGVRASQSSCGRPGLAPFAVARWLISHGGSSHGLTEDGRRAVPRTRRSERASPGVVVPFYIQESRLPSLVPPSQHNSARTRTPRPFPLFAPGLGELVAPVGGRGGRDGLVGEEPAGGLRSPAQEPFRGGAAAMALRRRRPRQEPPPPLPHGGRPRQPQPERSTPAIHPAKNLACPLCAEGCDHLH